MIICVLRRSVPASTKTFMSKWAIRDTSTISSSKIIWNNIIAPTLRIPIGHGTTVTCPFTSRLMSMKDSSHLMSALGTGKSKLLKISQYNLTKYSIFLRLCTRNHLISFNLTPKICRKRRKFTRKWTPCTYSSTKKSGPSTSTSRTNSIAQASAVQACSTSTIP